VKHIVVVGLQWVTAAVVLYVAWLLVLPQVSTVFIVSPDRVAERLQMWVTMGTAQTMVTQTLIEALTGLIGGFALGVILALGVGFGPRIVGDVIEPLIVAVYAMPKFVLIPLMFLWWGNGFGSIVGFVVLGVCAIAFISTLTGLRTVDPDLVRAVQLLGASRAQIASKLLLRHAMGHIGTGATFGTSFAILSTIGAEMLFGSSGGLGGTLDRGAELFDASSVLAALLLATSLGAMLVGLVETATRRLSVHDTRTSNA
jgi:NitT/TauT family transport system permease protein